jgi:glutamate synthase (NADPH/NADH) small chain
VKLMAQEGVNFVTGAWIGNNVPTAKLQAEFDAIVLCGGATAARDLQVEGRNLRGVHYAMEFLLKSCKSLLDSNFADRQFIDAKGKNVIVIGGGDTGTDCVGTALRHGCKSLVQFEILPRPPDLRAADNPWPQWPRVYKLDYGQEEAAALYGADPRRYVTVTKRLVGDAGGNLAALAERDADVVARTSGERRTRTRGRAASRRLGGLAEYGSAFMATDISGP